MTDARSFIWALIDFRLHCWDLAVCLLVTKAMNKLECPNPSSRKAEFSNQTKWRYLFARNKIVKSIFAGNIYIKFPLFGSVTRLHVQTRHVTTKLLARYFLCRTHAIANSIWHIEFDKRTIIPFAFISYSSKISQLWDLVFFSGSYINTVRARSKRKLSCLQVIRERWTTSFMWMAWFVERLRRDSIILVFGCFFITSIRTTSHICLRPFGSHGTPKRLRELRNTITNVKLDPITSTPYLRAFYFRTQHNTISV